MNGFSHAFCIFQGEDRGSDRIVEPGRVLPQPRLLHPRLAMGVAGVDEEAPRRRVSDRRQSPKEPLPVTCPRSRRPPSAPYLLSSPSAAKLTKSSGRSLTLHRLDLGGGALLYVELAVAPGPVWIRCPRRQNVLDLR